MERNKLIEMYERYKLEKTDVFKHQHFLILKRSAVEKIMALENIKITYEVIKCEPNFAVIKAKAYKGDKVIETFGSALKGTSFKDSNTNSWYVMEMAEKRALSRSVLKICDLYKLNIFGEDESEDFKQKNIN